MTWKDIIKNEENVSNFIKLAKDNMDKFDKDEKKIVNYLINSLENKYDKNTFEALRFELKKKDLLRAKGRIG
jgi:hypothetical protein|tara:strand:- start:2973 stop:3188 length:216 start_codon:yes stop_codon:yes gene_type:complete